MKDLKRKTVILLLAASMAATPFFSGLALARTAYVERNDTMPIENVTIALQSAMQIYQKYVLTNLANLKSIKGLGDLQESFGFINDIKKEIDGVLGKLNIADMIKLDNLTKDLGGDFGNILSQIGAGESGILGSLGSLFGIGGQTPGGIASAIMTGKLGSSTLAGGKNDLSGVAKEKGLGGAAVEAVSRTSQVMDEVAKRASSESGSDLSQAVMSGYSHLLKSVPMIHPEVVAAGVSSAKEGLKAYTVDDIGYFLTFFADSSKAIPLASIMQLLDRHMEEKSPYSDKKYKEKIIDEITKIQKELEDIAPEIIELESPETKTTRLMGVVIRQNELTLRQYETLTAVCADNIKMGGINAGLKTAETSNAITKNILSRITYFNQADNKMKKKYLKDTGINIGGEK